MNERLERAEAQERMWKNIVAERIAAKASAASIAQAKAEYAKAKVELELCEELYC